MRRKRQKKRPKTVPIFVLGLILAAKSLRSKNATTAILFSKALPGKAAPFPFPVITASEKNGISESHLVGAAVP